jgi:outer membrane receptor protein involved in Fe transport
MTKFRLRSAASFAAMSFAVLAMPAWAQDAQAEDDASADEPIIVTATRREQLLSDVPLAVSAIGGEALQNSGVTDLRALNQLAPSLIVSGATSETNFTARIRGIGTVGENPGLESSVALFIDGVYRSRTGAGLTELGEIERIEVLRGPQGTLFGRNASAGLLNVVTKKPSFEFGGYAAATYGNYDYWRLEGGVTGPIAGDTVAAKLEGVYMKRNGYVKQVTPGQPDVNDRDRYLIRGQLLFQPNSDVSFRLIGDYGSRSENCCAAVFLNPVRNLSRVSAAGSGAANVAITPNTLVPLLTALGANYQFGAPGEPFARATATTPGFPYTADSKDWGVSGELNWDFGGAKLTSITAYRDYKYKQGQDGDFNALDILHRADEDRRFRTFTQELRLQGEALGGRLDWLIGGYYANEKLDLEQNTQYGADYEKFANCLTMSAFLPAAVLPTNQYCINVPLVQATIPTLPPGALQTTLATLIANPARPGFGSLAAALGQPNIALTNIGYANTFRQDSRNYAVFTHNVFDVVEDKLQLTLGARYTNERKHLRSTVNLSNTICPLLVNSPLQGFAGTYCSLNGTGIGFAGTEPGTTRSEGEWTGTAVLSFKPIEDLMIYGSYSKGYKAGGYNLDVSALDRTCNATFDAACAARLALPANSPFNGRPEASDLQFEAEKVDAFEAGIKYNGRGIDINLAAFYSRFDNFQLNTFNGLTFEVTNVQGCKTDLLGADRDGSAVTGACAAGQLKPGVTTKGVEVEYILRPARDFTINGGFTYLDTKYSKNLVGTAGRPLSPVLFQLPGSRTFGAQYAITTAVAWTPRISDSLTGLVYVDMRYQSDVNTGSDLDLEKVQDGYGLVNARLAVYGEGRRWGVELWGQNLFNTKAQQIAADAPGQGSGTFNAVAAPASTGLGGTANQLYLAFPNEPRTYGVTVRFKY